MKLTVTFLLVLFVALPSIVSSTYFSQLALGHASPALAYSAAVVAEVALPNRVGTSAGLSTGPLIYDSNKSYVYVASQGCNSSACSGSWMIYAISDENNSVLAGIELGANSSVVSMAFNPSMGYVYVLTAYVNSSNFYPVSGVLVVISDSSNTILNELYIGNCSMGEILYDQGNDCIYVFGNNLITGSFVSVISAETYSFVANITSEPFYYPGDAAAYDPVDGYMFLCNPYPGSYVSVISDRANTVVGYFTTSWRGGLFAVDPSNGNLYIFENPGVGTIISGSDFTIPGSDFKIAGPIFPAIGITFDPGYGYPYLLQMESFTSVGLSWGPYLNSTYVGNLTIPYTYAYEGLVNIVCDLATHSLYVTVATGLAVIQVSPPSSVTSEFPNEALPLTLVLAVLLAVAIERKIRTEGNSSPCAKASNLFHLI